jgi:hypothetical protein
VTAEREHPRYAHEAAVTVRWGGKAFEGRTRNVSRGGLCADISDAVKVGADVIVDLVLVFDDDAQSEPLKLPARVVWCTPVDEAFQVGVSFKPLDARLTQYLTLFLRYLDDSRGDHAPREQSLDDRFR